jgi:thiol-disulfide isomerase/thioredoxin
MKKILVLAIFSLVFTQNVLSQLPNETIAPNFTGIDIYGNSYTLYELLDQGRTVILNFSTSWCVPCWLFQESQSLKETWNQFGPLGTNEIFVLFVEVDPNNNLACLNGDSINCIGATQGNWVTGIPYPIIDDANLAYLYEISFLPTIYAICPNRKIYETKQKSPEEYLAYAQNCTMPIGNNNANIIKFNSGVYSDYFCGNTEIYPNLVFQNLGNQSISTAKFAIRIDGNLIQEKTWMGNLITFGITSLDFSPSTIISDNIVDLSVELISVNDVQDESVIDNSMALIMVPNQNIVEENRIRLEMRTDGNPEQTRWEFRDGDGNVLYSGGNPNAQPGANQVGLNGGYNPLQFIKDTFNLLAPDCYEFYIVDDRGDGLKDGGFFKLLTMNGEIILEGGTFDNVSSNWLKAQNIPTSVKNPIKPKNQFNLLPNPVSDYLNISWEELEFEPTSLLIINNLGKVVLKNSIEGKTGVLQLLIASLPQGFYNVILDGARERKITKLIKFE